MIIVSNKFVTKEQAFTLIELLVILLIMSIVFTFATIRFTSFLSTHKIQTEQEEITSILSYAKTQAIINDMPVSVSFNDKGYVISKLIPTGLTLSKDTQIKSVIIKNVKYHSNVHFKLVVESSLGGLVIFGENGLSNPYYIRVIKDD